MLTQDTLYTVLQKAAEALRGRSEELSRLDAKFGDGDHGVTVNRIALEIERFTREESALLPKSFLARLGDSVTGLSGGAAAPLWGTFLGGLSLPIDEDAASIDAALLRAMLRSAVDEMRGITKAGIGSKTLMDALILAADRADGAEGSVTEVLDAASRGAQEGAKATESVVASFGRAKNYKERTLGTPDPGAVGVAVFFEALALEARGLL